MAYSQQDVLAALKGVQDPDLHRDLVELGMIQDVRISGRDVAFTLMLTTPACPLKEKMRRDCEEAVRRNLPELGKLDIKMTANVARDRALQEQELIPQVKNTIAVSSGKGGVGKTTVAVNLAIGLQQTGAAVGLLDCDIYGPNVPTMMGVHALPPQRGKKIVPPVAHGVSVMSMGFFLQPDEPVVWRGPMLHNVIRQFLGDLDWGELDYLVIDLPPGTGDAQLTLSQLIPLTGVVIVTTPQDVALLDARKGLAMFQKVNAPVLGIVENMSYYQCPKCGNREDIFSHGGGEKAAVSLGVPFLGAIPLQLSIREAGDAGRPILAVAPGSAEGQAFQRMVEAVAQQVSIANLAEAAGVRG